MWKLDRLAQAYRLTPSAAAAEAFSEAAAAVTLFAQILLQFNVAREIEIAHLK